MNATTITLHNTAPSFGYTEESAIEQKREIGVIQNQGMLFADDGHGQMCRVKLQGVVRWMENACDCSL